LAAIIHRHGFFKNARKLHAHPNNDRIIADTGMARGALGPQLGPIAQESVTALSRIAMTFRFTSPLRER
jgi:hypothetical protein